MKYGVQLYSLRKYIKNDADYRGVFSKLKEMGAEVVQLSASTVEKQANPSVVAKLVREFELPVCVTHVPFDRLINDTNKLAEEHLLFGCKEIGVGMMPKAYRENNYARLPEFIELMNASAERLREYGIAAAYHNHWFEFDRVGDKTIFDTLIDNTVNNVRFIPDTFWIKVGGEDPVAYIQKLSGRIRTIHLKDYKKTAGVPIFRAVGKGDLDFKAIVKSAEDAGAENAVVELDLSPNPWKSVGESLDYIKNNLQKV